MSQNNKYCIYATRNTEYHTRNGIVIAVRDRGSRAWNTTHGSLGLRAAKWEKDYLLSNESDPVVEPTERSAICFVQPTATSIDRKNGDQLVSSRIEHITVPSKDVIAQYPAVPTN